MRMHTRRIARLTDAFSKEVEGHAAMVAAYAVRHSFVRIHRSLRATPATAAGVADRPRSMEDMAALLDAGGQARAVQAAPAEGRLNPSPRLTPAFPRLT